MTTPSCYRFPAGHWPLDGGLCDVHCAFVAAAMGGVGGGGGGFEAITAFRLEILGFPLRYLPIEGGEGN